MQLKHALNGSSLFGYLVAEEESPRPKAAVSIAGRFAVWIREHFGKWRESLFPYVLLVCLLAVPFWWQSRGRRAAVFALVCSAVTFSAMLVTRDAGGSVHHIVLLWPMPHLFAGVAIGSLRPRWLLVSCASIPVLANLLVLNQYVSQFERNGAAGGFSDASYTLSDTLPEFAGATVYVIDWGISNSLDFLHSGRLKLRWASAPLISKTPNDAQRREIDDMLRDPGAVFLEHVREREEFSGVNERLSHMAEAEGYRKEVLRVIPDSNGRAVFELFRF